MNKVSTIFPGNDKYNKNKCITLIPDYYTIKSSQLHKYRQVTSQSLTWVMYTINEESLLNNLGACVKKDHPDLTVMPPFHMHAI